MYTKAIETDGAVAAYYANRAFAYIKEEWYGYAVADATKAIELDSSYVKGYYRRAMANMALGKYKDGLKDFRACSKLAPQDADARKNLAECEKVVRRIEFENAISVDKDTRQVSDTLEVESIGLSHALYAVADPV